jgi:hypothetical protein
VDVDTAAADDDDDVAAAADAGFDAGSGVGHLLKADLAHCCDLGQTATTYRETITPSSNNYHEEEENSETI